jgi:hypothetical protein
MGISPPYTAPGREFRSVGKRKAEQLADRTTVTMGRPWGSGRPTPSRYLTLVHLTANLKTIRPWKVSRATETTPAYTASGAPRPSASATRDRARIGLGFTSKSSVVMSKMEERVCWRAALLTRMSRPPSSLPAVATSCLQNSSSRRSPGICSFVFEARKLVLRASRSRKPRRPLSRNFSRMADQWIRCEGLAISRSANFAQLAAMTMNNRRRFGSRSARAFLKQSPAKRM